MRVLGRQEIVGLFQTHRQSLQHEQDFSMFIGSSVQIRFCYRESYEIVENYNNVLPFKGQEYGVMDLYRVRKNG